MWPDGEGPADDVETARARAKAERSKPEHKPKPNDPRDKANDDLEDPKHQKKEN